jgi:hypothetical protein
MRKNRLLLCALAALGVSACATSITVQVEKPPLIDTGGMKRIAVMPFSASGYTALESQAAQELTGAVRDIVLRTGRFTLVDAAEAARLRSAGGNLAAYADGIVSGELIALRVRDSSERQKDLDGKTFVVWTRDVSIDFMYQISRTRDNSIAGQRRKSDQTVSTSYDSRSDLEDPFILARRLIGYQLAGLAREIAPWTVRERRTLAREAENKAVKPRMKAAERLVKAGQYRPAMNVFSAVYAETGSFAAGYNEAVLAEIVEGLPQGIALMSGLARASANPKAAAELERMRRSLAEAEAVAASFRGSDRAVDAAIKRALAEILDRLPSGAHVSLLNASGSEDELMEYVTAELEGALINDERIRLVDRRSRSLLESEQRFQMSGAVDDASAVSIGHLLGVEALLMCSIAGTGGLRRLEVRMLSVETGEIVWRVSQEI